MPMIALWYRLLSSLLPMGLLGWVSFLNLQLQLFIPMFLHPCFVKMYLPIHWNFDWLQSCNPQCVINDFAWFWDCKWGSFFPTCSENHLLQCSLQRIYLFPLDRQQSNHHWNKIIWLYLFKLFIQQQATVDECFANKKLKCSLQKQLQCKLDIILEEFFVWVYWTTYHRIGLLLPKSSCSCRHICTRIIWYF